MKKISLLGSTGSIGVQALRVCKNLGFSVTALAAGRNTALLEEQARAFLPGFVCVADESLYSDLKTRLADLPCRVAAGTEAICEAAALDENDMVLNAIVGSAGLAPTLSAVEAGKTLALANKESLVAGGALVMRKAREKGVKIIPVDSEHSAIFQSAERYLGTEAVSKIILTASGGPFYGWTAQQLQQVTPQQALKHPNWDMGAKITIDSATMMNKGFESIEAMWLFDVGPDKIDIVVHRESILHSAVELADGSILGQMGVPDMCLPIQYALTYPERCAGIAPKLDLKKLSVLHFAEPDHENFPAIHICMEAMERGGLAPAAVNAANEQAVALFLQGKIGFTDIAQTVRRVGLQPQYSGQQYHEVFTLNDVLAADRAARREVLSLAGC